MPSSDRVAILDPHHDFASESWDVSEPRVESNVTIARPGTIEKPKPGALTSPVAPSTAGESSTALESSGDSLDGEETVWEGQTSTKMYLVRAVIGAVLTIAWGCLAVATWGFGYIDLAWVAWPTAAVLLIFWTLTAIKMFRATHSHHYRLTSRRLIVRTGLLRRRLDQVELLHVKDVYVQQSLLATWKGIGHVVVMSSEQRLPRATLYGIERPRHVMDSIWLFARAELDRKTSRIEQV